jgi:hypothetical protein
MELNFEFFGKIKYDMEFDAVVKIAYSMKKFARKMSRRRAEKAAKLAA